jgi:hypothetical protein
MPQVRPAWNAGVDLLIDDAAGVSAISWHFEHKGWSRCAETGDRMTVTMVDSRTLTRADGTTSLRLDTKEFGSIAFRIDLKAIELLRRELATAEAFLRQPTGKS